MNSQLPFVSRISTVTLIVLIVCFVWFILAILDYSQNPYHMTIGEASPVAPWETARTRDSSHARIPPEEAKLYRRWYQTDHSGELDGSILTVELLKIDPDAVKQRKEAIIKKSGDRIADLTKLIEKLKSNE